MTFKPIKNRVLIKPKEAVTQSPGGIYIPPTARDGGCLPFEAAVVAVGPGDEVNVQVGDIVVAPPRSGAETSIKGEKHFVMESKDILAVIGD